MKLLCANLGCGKDYQISNDKEEWINIDGSDKFITDLCWDLRKPLPYPNQKFDKIKAKDILEHFSKVEVGHVLLEWVRTLKIGGEIIITVPNIEAIIDFKGDTLLNLLFGEQIFNGVDCGPNGLHKWCYRPSTIKALVESCGLNVIELIPCDGTNMYCRAKRVR